MSNNGPETKQLKVSPLSQLRTRLRLRHLQLLNAIDARKSLIGAAEEIGMSQPAASKALKELEDLLGLELFSRGGRGMAINEQGIAVTGYARMVFDRLTELHEELVSIERADIGRVRIGAFEATTPELLATVIVNLKQSHPRLNLMIEVDTSDKLVHALEDEHLDLVVGVIPPHWSPGKFHYEPLSEEGLSIVIRPDHPVLRNGDEAGFAALARYSWILHPHSSPMRQIIDDAFLRERLIPPDNVVETSSILTIISVVTRSDLVSVVPDTVARFFSDLGVLRILPTEVGRRWAPYGIIIRKDKRQTPALGVVIDAIRKSSAEMHPGQPPGGEPLR